MRFRAKCGREGAGLHVLIGFGPDELSDDASARCSVDALCFLAKEQRIELILPS